MASQRGGLGVRCQELEPTTQGTSTPSQPVLCSVFSQIRELVPESQAYMDLLAFERKLDQTIMRKRVDIQEALKRPMKVGVLQLGCPFQVTFLVQGKDLLLLHATDVSPGLLRSAVLLAAPAPTKCSFPREGTWARWTVHVLTLCRQLDLAPALLEVFSSCV